LLGMDWGHINGHTHFFDDTETGKIEWQGSKQTGVGFNVNGDHNTGNYNIGKSKVNNPDFWYNCYKKEKDVNIYNVSLESKITSFPKIGFKEFYQAMHSEYPAVIQHRVRGEIRELLNRNLK